MGGIVFQYGTAAHLALLTVAPLFLFAFCGPVAQAVVLLWLALFGTLWIVMNPSPRTGEWPRDARHRIGWEIARYPFALLCIVALVLAVIRVVNTGIALEYNAHTFMWVIKDPPVPLLPGSVSGQALKPLAGLVALAVATLGVRHAIGGRARGAYLLLSGLLAAAAVVCWKLLAHSGANVPGLSALPGDPFHPGSLLGVYFLFAVMSWVESWSSRNALFELLSAVAVSLLLFGLMSYAPTFSVWAFVLSGLVILVAGAVFVFARRPSVAWFRTVVALGIVLVPVALLVSGELGKVVVWPVFAKDFFALRAAATSVAVEAWKGSTQLGLGLGAYPLAIGFFATPDDWQVLSVAQTAAPNGWVHFLFERGFLGCAVFLAGAGLLIWDVVIRYLRAGSAWSLSAIHLFGPVVLLAVIAVTFFECTFVQFEALMPVGVALALTAAKFQTSSEADHG